MPLDQIAAGGDRHDDAGSSVCADLSPHVFGDRLGGALGQVEEQLPPLGKDPAQEARHGENEMTMRNGIEDFRSELSSCPSHPSPRPCRRQSARKRRGPPLAPSAATLRPCRLTGSSARQGRAQSSSRNKMK